MRPTAPENFDGDAATDRLDPLGEEIHREQGRQKVAHLMKSLLCRYQLVQR